MRIIAQAQYGSLQITFVLLSGKYMWRSRLGGLRLGHRKTGIVEDEPRRSRIPPFGLRGENSAKSSSHPPVRQVKGKIK